MRQSYLGTKTRREDPVDEIAHNAKLLIRAGYIHKSMAGVYSFLPLGLRSLRAITDIIREEMDAVGGQEVAMSSLQSPDIWKKTGRWGGDSDEIWFRSAFHSGAETGFAWSHEEPAVAMMRHHIGSYRDLPCLVYQFQNKMRNEKRAKSGILRTREFLMKDLYSFCADEAQHREIYERIAGAYLKVFHRVGLGECTYRTFASGGIFSDFSEEFQAVIPAGEDTVYLHREKGVGVNKEVYTDETLEKLGLKRGEMEEVAASEVGNIFTFGTKYTEPLGMLFADRDGEVKPAYMGSYGIGVMRLLGVIMEKYGADGPPVLPPAVAPFTVHLIALGGSYPDTETLYRDLRRDIPVLYDDRDISAGEKFADADLIGIPYRIIVSDRTRRAGEIEYLNRMTGETLMLHSSAGAVLEKVQ